MNPLTGEKIIEIGGQKYTLKFTWRALSEIENKYGSNPNMFDALTVAGIAEAGLRGRYPELTAEKIMELAPPFVPFMNAVQEAVKWAYFGAGEIPKDDGVKKKSLPGDGFWQSLKHLFRRG